MPSQLALNHYWWLSDGRHLFPDFRSQSQFNTRVWALDKVKVAMALNIPNLEEMVAEALWNSRYDLLTGKRAPPRWVSDLLRVLTAKTLEEFCGGILQDWRLDPEEWKKCKDLKVPSCRREMLHTLCSEFHMLEKLNERPRKNAFFCGLFAVPKSNDLWRVIFDTRELNGFVRPPTLFRMAAVEDVFTTVRLFTFFMTFDIRHEFFQIPLPDVARNLFLFDCDGEIFRSKIWPMGFSHSPYVATCLCATLVILGVRRAGFFPEESSLDGSAPAKVISFFNKEGEEMGRVVIYLDNVLIATHAERTRLSIAAELFRVSRDVKRRGVFPRSGVVVKGSVWDPDYKEVVDQTGEQEDEEKDNRLSIPGVMLSENEVEYLNILWKKDSNDARAVFFKHTDTARWEMLRDLPLLETFRFWAHVAGVLMWDWQVSGEDKGSAAGVLDLCHSLGGVEDYDLTMAISSETKVELQSFVDTLLCGEWRCRRCESLPRRSVIVASDAMEERGAGVMWNRKGTQARVIYTHEWSIHEKFEAINVRETRAVIGTVYKAVESLALADRVLIILGTDNMTARAALRHWFYPGNRDLTKELQTLKFFLREKHGYSLLRVIYTPGEIQAADAPSRQAVLDVEKCKACYALLKEALDDLIKDEMKLNGLKRKR